MILQINQEHTGLLIISDWSDYRYKELFQRFLITYSYSTFNWYFFIALQWFIGNHMAKRLSHRVSIIIRKDTK